jgi:hypothetical protein
VGFGWATVYAAYSALNLLSVQHDWSYALQVALDAGQFAADFYIADQVTDVIARRPRPSTTM